MIEGDLPVKVKKQLGIGATTPDLLAAANSLRRMRILKFMDAEIGVIVRMISGCVTGWIRLFTDPPGCAWRPP